MAAAVCGRDLMLRPLAGPSQRAAAHACTPMRRRAAGRDRLVVRAAGSNSDFNADDIMAKYGLGSSSPSNPPAKQPAAGQPAKPAPAPAPARRTTAAVTDGGNGVFFLLLANVALFLADHVLHLPGITSLYLNHAHPQWWQWVTHAFCHANWQHLSANAFNLVVFGKLVEETEGAFGVVFTYVACALGAAVLAWLLTPASTFGAATVSVGASGAIFGLFSVSVLTRLRPDVKRLLEAAILGNFVVRQVLQEAQAQALGGKMIGGLAVGHMAHLGGALAGVLLVLALRALPSDDSS